jgi:hypothetical protein
MQCRRGREKSPTILATKVTTYIEFRPLEKPVVLNCITEFVEFYGKQKLTAPLTKPDCPELDDSRP